MRVSTAEFLRNYGALADRATSEPLTITDGGHDRLVVLSAQEYARLKRRDRQVFRVGELSEAEIAALELAEVPDTFAHLDAELAASDR